MKRRRSAPLLLTGLVAVGLLLLYVGLRLPKQPALAPPPTVAPDAPTAPARPALAVRSGDPGALLAWVRDQLRPHLGARGARPNEAVVSFANAADYQRFLAAAADAGLQVLGQLDGLFSVRVGASSPDALARGLAAHGDALVDVGGNPYVFTPQPPSPEARAAQRHFPFGDGMLAFLGVTTDHQLWGRGVTIAVIDSGVATDTTFGHGRVRAIDIGLGTAPEDGHGTAVAALAAGAAQDAPGVAPAASILSIRVTDATGVGDTFTLAQAIVTAVDSGARILNVSLGSYQSHPTLSRALDYAFARGAVVVASAGNDQAGSLTWPAADPRVVSVGAVDAIEQQVTFSNSGPQLQVSAPGYGVNTAWLDNERVAFSGTSASAPIVSGSIAAVMSSSPGISAEEAWRILSSHVSEAGPPGSDPNYGQGILNLGWAMARTDPTRVDTAVSSHYYNADAGTLDVVVQNRSAQGVAGLELVVDATTGSVSSTLPWLKPGGTAVVSVPVDEAALEAGAALIFRSRLTNPAGLVDQLPANNRKTSSLEAPAP